MASEGSRITKSSTTVESGDIVNEIEIEVFVDELHKPIRLPVKDVGNRVSVQIKARPWVFSA
jgi:hypothetical protein